jgi:hypothetical protein
MRISKKRFSRKQYRRQRDQRRYTLFKEYRRTSLNVLSISLLTVMNLQITMNLFFLSPQ